jgi:AsmA family/AsmA-like C-terminal region
MEPDSARGALGKDYLATDSEAEVRHSGPSWRHWLLLIVILLVVAAVVLPPLVNISRYKRRIATSISSSIGRPVHMSTVRLHLLPRPGFEISDFEVEEDPAFGDEPMLHCASMDASIRLSSLWRGRLEIGRISFDEPSLNLVRDAHGRWNFGTVLIKASQSDIAPTPQVRPGSALRFPYIEATNARINFKQGYEKKSLSFLNSDVSVWVDKPDEWRLRFEAQPARTDLDRTLGDTGIVRVDGTFRRAAQLDQVPITLHTEWTKAPLGQLTRLLADRDMGWRGDLNVTAEVTGTPANAQLKTRIRANDVHRLEFASIEPMDLDATCQGNFVRATGSLQDLACNSPIGKGKLMVAGAIRALSSDPKADIAVHMEQVPVSALFEMVRSVRDDFAPSLVARGSMDGDFRYGPQQGFAAPILDGSATIQSLELSSPFLEAPILVPQLRLVTTTGNPTRDASSVRNKFLAAVPNEPALLLEPFSLSNSETAPLLADGNFTADRFRVHLAGSIAVKKLAAIGKSFGFLSPAFATFGPVGVADVNLTMRGTWLVPVTDIEHPPTATADGTIDFKNARIATSFLASPIDLPAATGNFKGNQVTWEIQDFNFAGLRGNGFLTHPLPCTDSKSCALNFDFHFGSVDMAELETALLGGTTHGSTLKDLLAGLNSNSRPWPTLNGTLSAITLQLANLSIHNARASIAIAGTQTQIKSLDGECLGGTLQVNGSVDTTEKQPHYALDVELSRANAAEIAMLFHEKWGSGTVNTTAHLDLSGYTGEKLSDSAEGNFHWDWFRGSLPGAPEDAVSHFDRWQASGAIGNQHLTMDHGALFHAGEFVPVTGTISFNRDLKLRIGRGNAAILVTGTAQNPLVTGGTAPTKASASVDRRSGRTSP